MFFSVLAWCISFLYVYIYIITYFGLFWLFSFVFVYSSLVCFASLLVLWIVVFSKHVYRNDVQVFFLLPFMLLSASFNPWQLCLAVALRFLWAGFILPTSLSILWEMVLEFEPSADSLISELFGWPKRCIGSWSEFGWRRKPESKACNSWNIVIYIVIYSDHEMNSTWTMCIMSQESKEIEDILEAHEEMKQEMKQKMRSARWRSANLQSKRSMISEVQPSADYSDYLQNNWWELMRIGHTWS